MWTIKNSALMVNRKSPKKIVYAPNPAHPLAGVDPQQSEPNQAPHLAEKDLSTSEEHVGRINNNVYVVLFVIRATIHRIRVIGQTLTSAGSYGSSAPIARFRSD